MLAIISPAKKLDFESDPITDTFTEPVLIKDTKKLAKQAKNLTRADLRRMMSISEQLAELNFQRFQDFKPTANLANARQAALSFAGDTYVGLDATSLNKKDLAYAQDHLRILSGLYGLLRPLDLMQPYRLEMGTKFAIGDTEDLYGFWIPASPTRSMRQPKVKVTELWLTWRPTNMPKWCARKRSPAI